MLSHRLAGLMLLLFLPAHVAALTPITNANVAAAATAWVTDPVTATATYGPISDWNTAAVTSMANLFLSKRTFNGDISKWNVARVANMYQVFWGSRVCVCARLCVWVCTAVRCMRANYDKSVNYGARYISLYIDINISLGIYR
jgi:hypothetical protein